MKRIIICLLFWAVMIGTIFASHSSENETKEEKFDATEMIMHHIGDSHEWHIISFNKGKENEVHLTIPLPVILWYNGLHVFSSARLHHEKVIQIGENFVTYEHGHFYLSTSKGSLLYYGDEKLIKPLDFSITKNVASMLMGALILLLVFGSAANGYAKRGGLSVPRGIQLLVEPLVLFIKDDIIKEQIHDKRKANFFTPYLMTLFCFIIINNLIGLVPFFPGGSNVSGNISFTVTMAVISFLAVNIFASKTHWKHTFLAPGIPIPIKIFIVPVEFIGLFTKPFALMLRLFANITAGHIIILSLTSIIFVLGTLAASPLTVILSFMMFCLELLVAFLQAYIFTLLTALFIGMAVNEAH
jgi:F-type H+-transporting ATPase subunit a